jgi:lipopolysaccharide biosynthesis glycosyltransferase
MTINVVLASDDGFAMPLTVAAHSVVRTLEEDEHLDLWLLDMGITAKNRQAVASSLTHPRVDVHWIDSLGDKVSELPNTWPNITRAGYARLFIPQSLPESVDRVLYLDCDVLARTSVGKLYSADMGGHAAMGAPDVQSPFVSSPAAVPWWFRNGRDASEPNINSGVLLMDLVTWRRDGLADEMLRYLTDGRHEFGQDQEAINAVLRTDIALMDPRWNQQSELFQKMYEVELPYDTATLETLRADPWIIHFSNAPKPWNYGGGNHPFVAEWFSELDQTAFAGQRPSLAKHVTKRAKRVPAWALTQLKSKR